MFSEYLHTLSWEKDASFHQGLKIYGWNVPPFFDMFKICTSNDMKLSKTGLLGIKTDPFRLETKNF